LPILRRDALPRRVSVKYVGEENSSLVEAGKLMLNDLNGNAFGHVNLQWVGNKGWMLHIYL
jgi:hypothetical protein